MTFDLSRFDRTPSQRHDDANGALCKPDAQFPSVCAICRCGLGNYGERDSCKTFGADNMPRYTEEHTSGVRLW